MRENCDLSGDLQCIHRTVQSLSDLHNLHGKQFSPEERLIKIIYNLPTSGKSDYFAGYDQQLSLLNDIDQTRQLILRRGRPWSEHPDYSDVIAADPSLESRFQARYWHNIGSFYASTDLQLVYERLEIGSTLVTIDDVQRGVDVDIAFDPQPLFSLQIYYHRDGGYYSSGVSPFENMTDQEYRIIRYYLEEYLGLVS